MDVKLVKKSHKKVDSDCPECMKWVGRIQRNSGDDEAWEQLYGHLGRKLHPIK